MFYCVSIYIWYCSAPSRLRDYENFKDTNSICRYLWRKKRERKYILGIYQPAFKPNLSILIYIYTYIGTMHIYLSRFENDGSSATATRERRNERIINIYIYIRVGIWNGIPRSNIRYNVCTEKSEFPSDPFRYNRDVSNYSFDILPINVRDVDGWDWKKMPPPIVPRKVSLPRARESSTQPQVRWVHHAHSTV
jgi:hypothetical protein